MTHASRGTSNASCGGTEDNQAIDAGSVGVGAEGLDYVSCKFVGVEEFFYRNLKRYCAASRAESGKTAISCRQLVSRMVSCSLIAHISFLLRNGEMHMVT